MKTEESETFSDVSSWGCQMCSEHLELYSDHLEEPKADLGDGSGWTSFLQTETVIDYFLGLKTRNLQ